MNILITGGSGGLGKAIVECLAQIPGNQIYFTYNTSLEAARALEKRFHNIKKIKCDFRETASVDKFIEEIEALKLETLINNAAPRFRPEHFHKLQPDDIEAGFKSNILPVLRITQCALAKFRKQEGGRIITVLSSAIVSNPPAGWSEYTAGKSYLLAMSRAWATENIKFNISANCISPSFMETEFNAGADARVVESLISRHPLKKLLTVQEVAETVNFLVTAPLHINGQNLILNAGQPL